MEYTYLIIQGFDKRLSVRYQLYTLNCTPTQAKTYTLAGNVNVHLTDAAGMKKLFEEFNESGLITYGSKNEVPDPDISERIVSSLDTLIEEKEKAIIGILENVLIYNSDTKKLERPPDHFLD